MPKLVGGSGIPFIFCPKIVLIAVYVLFVPDGSTGWWYNISYFVQTTSRTLRPQGKCREFYQSVTTCVVKTQVLIRERDMGNLKPPEINLKDR